MQVDFEMPRRAFGCREIGHEKGFLMPGKFEMQRRLSDAGKGDCHETDGGYD